MDTGVLRSPKRSGRGPYKPVDDFNQTFIRNKIQEFYTVMITTALRKRPVKENEMTFFFAVQ